MNKDNLACYECPKGKKNGLHHWILRLFSKTAYCKYCGLELTKEQADAVWRE